MPSGNAASGSSASGNDSLTSSSPRDHNHTRPARLTAWARMPSYFHSTSQSLAGPSLPSKASGASVELMREEERIRLPAVAGALRVGRGEQRRVARRCRRRAGIGVAHHALRHQLGVEARGCRQRALHQQLADADAKAAADQLDEQERLGGVQAQPPAAQRRGLHLGRLATQRQQPLLDPFGQAGVVVRDVVIAQRQHVRDRLGEVAHRLVAGLEQPVVDAGGLARGLAQHGGGHGLARLAAGQKVGRPGGVGRRRG